MYVQYKFIIHRVSFEKIQMSSDTKIKIGMLFS